MSDVERENAVNWYSAGRECTWGNRERLVRVWRPGDGLQCSAAGYQKRHPCPVPVAVVKDVLLERPGRNDRSVINRVVCVRHLAASFGADPAPAQEASTERAALERLAQAHWDEYAEILADMREAQLRERLSILPGELREQVVPLILQAAEGNS